MNQMPGIMYTIFILMYLFWLAWAATTKYQRLITDSYFLTVMKAGSLKSYCRLGQDLRKGSFPGCLLSVSLHGLSSLHV